MKNLIKILLFASFFTSCENNTSKVENPYQQIDSIKIDTVKVATIQNDSTIKDESFKPLISRAILIGEKIELLDENEKVIKDISNQKETIIKVIAKSMKLNHYKIAKEPECNEFYWVKVIVNKDTGYIDGNRLYEPYKHSQNKTYKVESNEIEITLTKTMGQREFDELEDPLYCFSDKPIIFKEKKTNYEGLVGLKPNNYRGSEFDKYFCLHDDDGYADEIKKMDFVNNKYVLTILRGFQEGGAIMIVEIYKTELKKYMAEIIEYKELEEEEYQKQINP